MTKIRLKFWLLLPAAFLMLLPGFSAAQKSDKENRETIVTNIEGTGQEIIITVVSGKSHNHPMMAAWLEDSGGKYIQTLYANKSVASGYFAYADPSEGKWKPGKLVRPASLPVWAHRRGVQVPEGHYMPTQEHPLPDAITSATPAGDFVLEARSDKPLSGKIRVLFEINQSWDWNDYWNNSKFPGDNEYKSSSQPSVVYSVEIDLENPTVIYMMKPVGHGHYSGLDGSLNPDMSSLTTALEIVKEISVQIISR